MDEEAKKSDSEVWLGGDEEAEDFEDPSQDAEMASQASSEGAEVPASSSSISSGRGPLFAAHELAEIARLRRMGVTPPDAKSAKWFWWSVRRACSQKEEAAV